MKGFLRQKMPDFQLVDQGYGILHNIVLKNISNKLGEKELKLDNVGVLALFELISCDDNEYWEVVNVLVSSVLFLYFEVFWSLNGFLFRFTGKCKDFYQFSSRFCNQYAIEGR